jgi:hypothetical protein
MKPPIIKFIFYPLFSNFVLLNEDESLSWLENIPFFGIIIFVGEKKKNNSDAISIPKNSLKTPEISTASGGT